MLLLLSVFVNVHIPELSVKKLQTCITRNQTNLCVITDLFLISRVPKFKHNKNEHPVFVCFDKLYTINVHVCVFPTQVRVKINFISFFNMFCYIHIFKIHSFCPVLDQRINRTRYDMLLLSFGDVRCFIELCVYAKLGGNSS